MQQFEFFFYGTTVVESVALGGEGQNQPLGLGQRPVYRVMRQLRLHRPTPRKRSRLATALGILLVVCAVHWQQPLYESASARLSQSNITLVEPGVWLDLCVRVDGCVLSARAPVFVYVLCVLCVFCVCGICGVCVMCVCVCVRTCVSLCLCVGASGRVKIVSAFVCLVCV